MRARTAAVIMVTLSFFVLVIHSAIFSSPQEEVPQGDASESPDISVLLSSNPHGASHPLVILVHDVSPLYLNDLREITGVISSYGLQNETYLFVITDHAGRYPITKYPEFTEYLKTLEGEGYHIELHAYTHRGREFYCNTSEAEYLLGKALKLMAVANLSRPKLFIPPRYAVSEDALDVLLSSNITVINGTRLYLPNGTVYRISNHEYTWYLPKWKLPIELWKAKRDFRKTKGTFYLSIHPKAINEGAGMEFLNKFLKFVLKERGK